MAELRNDPRVDRKAAPATHVSKVVHFANANHPVVELTVSTHVNPSDADALKETLLDRISDLIGVTQSRELSGQPAE